MYTAKIEYRALRTAKIRLFWQITLLSFAGNRIRRGLVVLKRRLQFIDPIIECQCTFGWLEFHPLSVIFCSRLDDYYNSNTNRFDVYFFVSLICRSGWTSSVIIILTQRICCRIKCKERKKMINVYEQMNIYNLKDIILYSRFAHLTTGISGACFFLFYFRAWLIRLPPKRSR